MRQRSRLIALLLLFVGGAVAFQILYPFMEGVDEDLHFNYVTLLRTENRLPDRATFETNTTLQESGQPPLTYWITARFLDLLNLPRYAADVRRDLDAVRNRWSYPFTGAVAETDRRTDNHNVYEHGAAETLLPHPEIIELSRAARIPSLAFGLLAVVGAYGAAREVFKRLEWALTAAALFALMPQFVYMNAILTNDISSTAFATLGIWQTLRLLRRGTSVRRLIVLGLLLGLCGLSKVSALAIAPGVGLVLLFDHFNRRRSWLHTITDGLIVALTALIVVGPWMLYGAITAGDPLGTATHTLFEGSAPTFAQLSFWLSTLYTSYWGQMNGLQFGGLTYGLFTVLLALSIAGYVRFAVTRQWLPRLAGQQAAVLGCMVVGTFGALIQWITLLFSVGSAITGRLLYPVHIALVLALTAGLMLLVQRFPHRVNQIVRLYAVSLVAVASLILAPVSFAAVFSPPPVLSNVSGLSGAPLDFDQTIRFLGYRQADPFIRENTFHTITLCWQVQRLPARPAAFAIKIFGDDGAAVAERTSVHGMGRYPTVLWHVGDIFCDDVDMRVKSPLQPGHTYHVALVLLDDRTRAANWQITTPDGKPVGVPFIADVVSPAGIMTVENLIAARIEFPGFAALSGYRFDQPPAPGSALNLDLLWDVTGHADESWTQFIHLVGPNTAAVLADGIPRSGGYPTWAWSRGEHVADHWTLNIPAGLTPGDYSILIGFATPQARLAARLNGADVPDRAVPLLTFHVG